jgi:methionine--tRNA ligase
MGHAFEKIGADAMARYHRLKGEQVRFLIGLDEHGLKVMQTAAARSVTPQQWVDEIAATFRAAWRQLLISNDDFIRTTEPRHRRGVEEVIQRILAADDLYRAKYSGYYCVGCEAFKKKDELEEVDGVLRCPLHPGRELNWSEEENWFFRLSRYQDRLLKLLDDRPDFVQPDIRRNEIRRVIENGLEDISVSRANLPWGIPWPGDEQHTVYVWLDALTNYLSATGFPQKGYEAIWPADVHVIGKDITRFHCIYWPAFLMSAGSSCLIQCGGTASSASAAPSCPSQATSASSWISDSAARSRGAALFPAGGHPVERRRRVLFRAVRRAVRGGPVEQRRQSGQPRRLHDRALPRWNDSQRTADEHRHNDCRSVGALPRCHG